MAFLAEAETIGSPCDGSWRLPFLEMLPRAERAEIAWSVSSFYLSLLSSLHVKVIPRSVGKGTWEL